MFDSAPDIKTEIRNKLKLRHIKAQSSFKQNFPQAHKFLQDSGVELGKIRQHSTKLLTAGAISGALLLPAAHQPQHISLKDYPSETAVANSRLDVPLPKNAILPIPQPVVDVLASSGQILSITPRQYLTSNLREVLPPITNRFSPPFLTYEDEKVVEQIVTRATGISAKRSLEGEHLNTTYGYIGAEQHLARYPGDTIGKHDMQAEGMAPGLGGFGYFNTGGQLTQDAVTREKYYVVAQLMYLPDWKERTRYLANWYKWRKIIIVNPENGNAVVGDMGDAGPAAWTGKHFGGSPEVMDALGGPRYKKGRVLFFFVDDPENKIPLGPVRYDEIPQQVLQQI